MPTLTLSLTSVKRSTGFGQPRLARSPRAKTECGADAGRRNGSAIALTEDKAARRFAAARTAPGSTDRTRAILRSTFEAVPDAPVSRFELTLKGGPKYGLLENSEGLCRKPQKATAAFTAQNGKELTVKPVISNSCGGGKRSKKHAKHHGGKR